MLLNPIRRLLETVYGAPTGEWFKTDPDTFGGGRNKPYTEEEITGRMCSRKGCSREAYSTWQACADNRIHRPLCAEHDIELNRIALMLLGDPDWQAKVTDYAHEVAAQIDRPLDILWLTRGE